MCLDRERSRVCLLRSSRAPRGPLPLARKAIRSRTFSTSGSVGPAEPVAPDGGRMGDVRDQLVVDDDPQSQDDLEPRTQRAVNGAMDVSLLSKGGRYEV